jgi:signal transduction histidine kinase/ActR/RegA family two-component response regulator
LNVDLTWRAQPRRVQAYVAAVIAAGAAACAAYLPLSFPHPGLFGGLLAAACLTSIWKVNLPIPLASGSTLSVSYAADLMALLLLGPRHALVIAVAGAWAQCTFNVQRRYALYRTVFSMAAEAVTMAATAAAYAALGGTSGPDSMVIVARPVVGAIATYFLVNTWLVAGAIALSIGRPAWQVWRDDFLWSGTSFIVAGGAGAVAAVVVERGAHWLAILLIAPVYLTYRTYRVFVLRLDDERRYVAERNRLLDNERAARTAAEQANRVKDQFLATVSHELRTPLNAILGWADILRSGQLAAARRERALQAIYDSAKRQARLIDELLDVARIMSGKLQLERAQVKLAEAVRGAIEIVQPSADAKRIHIVFDADTSVGLFYGDGARLQQIAWNLLANAVKFTPEGGVIHVGLRRVQRHAELLVTDTGQGIPAAFLTSVFEPFRQVDASTTRPQGGLGLGLSIVKYLVDAHGGTIAAESGGAGCGSTFTVTLPVDDAPDEARPDAMDPALKSAAVHVDDAPVLDGLRVLVVDDDDQSRDVVVAYLETHHASVRTAASAAQAFDILQHERVDVLLADVAMPGEDGYSLIRRLRALEPSGVAAIPAAALTAFARDEDRRRALQAGFQLHLPKPIDVRSLVDAVASLARPNPT